MNVKGLGKNQIRVLKKMAIEDLKICGVYDYYTMKLDIFLSDQEGDNSYEILTDDFVESLYKRKLLDLKVWMPSIRVEIRNLNLLPKAKEYILKIP